MPLFRAKAIEVDAYRWERNGDHPSDGPRDQEGAVVHYFRHPEIAGWKKCQECQYTYDSHGWLDDGMHGHKVCPGDWIVRQLGDTYLAVKPELFVLTYDLVDERAEEERALERIALDNPGIDIDLVRRQRAHSRGLATSGSVAQRALRDRP